MIFVYRAKFVLLTVGLTVPGFFVDINLFKASKEKAAEVARNNDGVTEIVNDSNVTSGKDGLADDDANLMIKLKFLTYKVCVYKRYTNRLSVVLGSYMQMCSCLGTSDREFLMKNLTLSVLSYLVNGI